MTGSAVYPSDGTGPGNPSDGGRRKIALTPAVELSCLAKQEQRNLLETMESEDCTPSLSQAIQMKKLSQLGFLDMDRSLRSSRNRKPISRTKSASGWMI